MPLSRFKQKVRRFSSDRRGNTAIIFALSAIALIGMAGLGVDYFKALSAKAKLDLAADAAAIAAINTAQNYVEANSGSMADPTPQAIVLGQAQAAKVFAVNAGRTMNITATPSVTMSRTGQTINATVSYQAASPNSFGPIFGINQINMTGLSSSSLTIGKYLDFYLLLDVSGSMGLPSTTAGQQALAAISPDNKNQYPSGCAFACHFSQPMCTTIANPAQNQACQGYNLARTNNIQLRADAVGDAVTALLQTAQKTETIPNQYRIGLYPFIANVGTLYSLSTNLAGATSSAATLGTLLDNGDSTTVYGSGGTHFENVLPQMNTLVTNVGDGSGALQPQPFVFLVTDGADNNQYWNSVTSSWTGSQPRNMDPTLCSALKSRGITVAVLYIPYMPIQPPFWTEDLQVNAIIPTIPSNMQSCASTGFFFTANTPADITNAMQTMFAQSLAAARLTR